ncbi:hypothetical protein [Kineococcus radiotolerans]|uniref:hypothetical protein n=1 Tax=Kineococcus radiotolerans TaxID=131568 RepID=UPI0035D45B0E
MTRSPLPRKRDVPQAWAQIEALLPPMVQRGGRWRNHRQVLNAILVLDAILWKLRAAAPCPDLPQRHGPWKTAHKRLRTRTADRAPWTADRAPWTVHRGPRTERGSRS